MKDKRLICPICSSMDIDFEAVALKGAHGYTQHCLKCGDLRCNFNVDESLEAIDDCPY